MDRFAALEITHCYYNALNTAPGTTYARYFLLILSQHLARPEQFNGSVLGQYFRVFIRREGTVQCPPECWLHTQLGFRGASEEDGSILLFPWYEKPYCLPATSFNLWHRIYYFDLFLKKISCASEDHRSVLLCNYTMWTFILTFMNWFYVCLKSFSTTTEHHIEYCLKLLTDWVIWFGKSRNETVMRLYMTILWIKETSCWVKI